MDFNQIFNYVYAILQNLEFQDVFSTNLKRELPRIPAVRSGDDFLAFAEAGRQLIDLHLQYEKAEEYPVTEIWNNSTLFGADETKKKYYVKKMKFVNRNEKTSIQYNPYLKIEGIPNKAYEFKINGKSCVEWVMDRQKVTIHKDSGIVNDPNDFANESMNNPAYPLELLKKAITVGIRTLEIQKSMPPLRIHKDMGG